MQEVMFCCEVTAAQMSHGTVPFTLMSSGDGSDQLGAGSRAPASSPGYSGWQHSPRAPQQRRQLLRRRRGWRLRATSDRAKRSDNVAHQATVHERDLSKARLMQRDMLWHVLMKQSGAFAVSDLELVLRPVPLLLLGPLRKRELAW